MKFNIRYFIPFIVLFITEMIIAFYVKQEFIRYTFGDYLAVMLIYCFIRSFISLRPFIAAIITLAIALIVEFLQLIDILSMLNIQQNTFTKLVFGTTFSIEDLVAYTLGIITILIIEKTVPKN